MDNSFSASLKIHDGRFYFIIPEWNLISEGESLEAAYQELLRKKEELVQQFSRAGSLGILQSSTDAVTNSGTAYRKLLLFLAKVAIIAAVAVWAVLIAVWVTERAAKSIMHTAVQTVKQAPMDMLHGIGDRLVREAELEKTVTQAERERMRETEEARLKALRLAVKRVKPYMDEIAALSPCQQDSTMRRGR